MSGMKETTNRVKILGYYRRGKHGRERYVLGTALV
jgi:hypothetical protein